MDRIRPKGGTEAEWISLDPILMDRELALTIGPDGKPNGLKAGDGVSLWSELSYLTGGGNGITPHIGINGNWYIGTDDTGIHAQGIQGMQGIQGISGPLTICLFKQGANGIVFPQRFKWTENKTVSSVQLLSNCASISVTIGATTYNQITLVGITLTAGTELVINDITIQAGFDNANAIIIF